MNIDPTSLQSAASIVAHSLTASHVNSSISAKASSSSSSAASTGATISSNDFLSLLVTEMKNQDPTQPTDPNAYIQQLVGVNSLQQLISINKDLAPAPTASSPVIANGSAVPVASI